MIAFLALPLDIPEIAFEIQFSERSNLQDDQRRNSSSGSNQSTRLNEYENLPFNLEIFRDINCFPKKRCNWLQSGIVKKINRKKEIPMTADEVVHNQ